MFTDTEWDALRGDVPPLAWFQMRRELLEPILVEMLERLDEEDAEPNDDGEYGFHLSPFLLSDEFRDPTAVLTIGNATAFIQYSQLIPTVEPIRRWISDPESW